MKIRRILFYILVIILTLLPLLLIRYGIRGDALPIMPIMIVYFYAIHCPVPLMVVFIYGLFASEILGSPLGLESFLFIILYYLCSKYRVALLSRGLLSIFLGFCLVVIAYGISKYFVISCYHHHWFEFTRVTVQIVASILFYPLANLLLCKVLAKR